jgi:ATP:ADP antiporter, AAA family
MGAYYLLNPVREALILSESGAEVKSYSGAAQALLLLAVVPFYGWFVTKSHVLQVGIVFFLGRMAGAGISGLDSARIKYFRGGTPDAANPLSRIYQSEEAF